MTHSIHDFDHGYQEEGKLLGVACACGFKTATSILRCPRCGKGNLKEVTLPSKGHVVSYSVQNVPSDEFLNDAPYTYALIELEDGSRISGWMPEVKKPEDIQVGDRVHWKASYKPGVVFEKDGVSP